MSESICLTSVRTEIKSCPTLPWDQSVALADVCEACFYTVITNCITIRSAQFPDSSSRLLKCNIILPVVFGGGVQTSALHPRSDFLSCVCSKMCSVLQAFGYVESKVPSHLPADQYIGSVNITTHQMRRSSLRKVNPFHIGNRVN